MMRSIMRYLAVCATLFMAGLAVMPASAAGYPDHPVKVMSAIRRRRPDRRHGAANRPEAIGESSASSSTSRTLAVPAAISARPRPHWRPAMAIRSYSRPPAMWSIQAFTRIARMTRSKTSLQFRWLQLHQHPRSSTLRLSNQVKELIALIKANPGKFTFASPGIGDHAASCKRAFQSDV